MSFSLNYLIDFSLDSSIKLNLQQVLVQSTVQKNMQNYKIQSKRGEGTYSQVFMAIQKSTLKKVALKIMKHKYQNIQKIKKDKEIKALKTLSHPNIIQMYDVLYNEEEQKMALVFQLMDCNLYEYYKNKAGTNANSNPKNNNNSALTIQKIRNIGFDILQAVNFMHAKGVFHRDIKPQNILVMGDKTFKLADLGSCKNMHSSLPFTEYISTRWYRAPQCLMTDGYYSEKMDVWSVGCVLFELFTQYPLFPGKDQVDQISTIFSILGTPQEKTLYKFAKRTSNIKFDFQQIQGIGIQNLMVQAPAQLIDLLQKMLTINPNERISAKEALNHSFFYSLTQLKKYRKSIITKITQSKDFVLPLLKSGKRDKF